MSAVLTCWNELCQKRPGALALIDAATGKNYSREEVDVTATAWAATHAAGGLNRRAVLFAVPNGITWLEIFLGILKAGGVAVPLDSSEPVQRQASLRVSLKAAYHWQDSLLVGDGDGRHFKDPDTCLIKLTSGSTGQPRPLVFTGKQMLADARAIGTTMGLRLRDVNYGLIPFGHSYGLGNLTFPLVCMGVPIACGSSALPHAIASDFKAYKPSVFPGVPALFRGLVHSEVSSLPGLRLAISAGAPLPADIAKSFYKRFHLKIHGFYGSSETGGIAYDSYGDETLEGSGTGRPLDGVQVEALKGEKIRVSGPAVFTINNRMRTRSRGSWSPGDRVQIGKNGSLQLLGRRDKTVKLSGRRLGLEEVVSLIRSIAGVTDVWVGISEDLEPVLGAAVATKKSISSVREALLALCPPWKVPKRWAAFESLPTNSRGKVDTARIKSLLFPKIVGEKS